MLLAVRRGHENTDIFTNDLGRAVAEEAFGGGVDGFDEAAFINGDDALDGGFENRPQPFLAVAHGGGRLLFLRLRPAHMPRLELLDGPEQLGLRHFLIIFHPADEQTIWKFRAAANLNYGRSHARSARAQLLPVFGGRLAEDSFEHAVEMRQGLEADFKRDFADAQIGIEQQVFGLLDPHA